MLIQDVPQSGSIAGSTSSHNRYGQYRRNRRSPTQTPTTRRTLSRSILAAASAAFAGISTAKQAAWASYADGHPVVNRLGQSVKLDAHAMFVRCRCNQAQAGIALTDTPPTTDVVDWTPEQITVANNSTSFTVDLSDQPATTQFLIAAGPIRGAGRNYEGKFSQLCAVAGGDAEAIDIATLYTARWGTPVTGDVSFIRVTPVSAAGVAGSPLVIRSVKVNP